MGALKSMGRVAKRSVKFQLQAPAAKEVKLAGDFNSWDQNSIKLARSKNGTWSKEIDLKPGKYEYKFIIDGQWQKDPSCPTTVRNNMGSENSVISIS